MLLAVRKCPICHKYMMEKIKESDYNNKIFPIFYDLTQTAQIKNAGVVYQSNFKIDNENICIECAESGKASFECALCGERKSSSLQKEAIGDPAEFLCIDCYNNKSAAIWENKVHKLYEKHRYDYE